MTYSVIFRSLAATALVAGSVLFGQGAQAATVALTSAIQCSAGNQQNGIQINDVTGNAGGATDCWGTVDGNDSQQTGTGTGDGFTIGTMLYEFVAKYDVDDDKHSGADIGLVVGGLPGTSGTWSIDPAKFSAFGDFLIVLKAASSPGYAVWLFEGAHAASTSGTWNVAWGHDLSHLAIYAKMTPVPIPAAGFLLLGGLGGLALLRRRRKT